jgi:hypothetical protein
VSAGIGRRSLAMWKAGLHSAHRILALLDMVTEKKIQELNSGVLLSDRFQVC